VGNYFEVPLALVVGSLHALPTASFGYRCSKNTTAARNSLLEAFEYFKKNTTRFDGFQSLHDFFSYFPNIGLNCYYAFM
jgi:hypothetical protein